MQVFNHKQLPLKKRLPTCLASHPLVVTVQEIVEITEKVCLSTLWYQKAQELGDKIAEYAIQNMASRGISYIIWKQRFYAPFDSKYGPANTWNPMPDPW